MRTQAPGPQVAAKAPTNMRLNPTSTWLAEVVPALVTATTPTKRDGAVSEKLVTTRGDKTDQ